MFIRRWIRVLFSILFKRSVRGQKPKAPRTGYRPRLEGLEDRLPPAAGLTSSNQQLLSAYGQLPLSFEANQGQTAAQVQYLTQTNGGTLFLTPTGAVLSLTQPGGGSGLLTRPDGSGEPSYQNNAPTTGVALALNLVAANPSAAVVGLDQLPGISNYFIGNDPSQWHTSIPNYAKVEYQNVYPGINLVYYGNQQQLEYDYQLVPGADPSSIRFAVQGADSLGLDAQGNLILHTAIGDVLEHAPAIYQQLAGAQQPVSGQFVLLGNNEVGFQVGAYDASKALVIDPVLSYSTYLGGSGNDNGAGIAVDGSGDAYITGETSSTNFPTTAGAFHTSYVGNFDAFVTKLNANGTALVYSTYLGGSLTDAGYGIAVDASGNAYVTGGTQSTNFPTTAGAFQTSQGGSFNAFITKLNANGTALVYSTYLGGSNSDTGYGIAVDSSGNAYVTGNTQSTNFPTSSGAFQTSTSDGDDAFVTKLNASGAGLIYCTYLGGSNYDEGYGIAVDASGNAYVTGVTQSTNFPTTSGAFQTSHASDSGSDDGFVTKLNASGTGLVYSTYLGGNNADFANGIAVDGSGNAYVGGGTRSTNFPTTTGAFQTTNHGFQNAFITKLNPSGTGLIYSTYLGGSSADSVTGIALDGSGDAYVTGFAGSHNFPTTAGAFQTSHASDGTNVFDAFLTKLNTTGTGLVYSTYLGGNDQDESAGIALDMAGNAYITGRTFSTNFPTTGVAFQTSFGGVSDAFVAKFGFGGPAVTGIAPSTGSSAGGTVVTITGTGFSGATAVRFGSTNVTTFTVNSATQITVTSPAGAGIVDVTVVTPIGTSLFSSADQFTYALDATTTTLTDNGPNPSTYNESVSFTATVSGGSDTDGETVFIEDATNANAVVASPTLTDGTVTFTISNLTVGTHDLFAVYNGDATNAGSNSSDFPVTQVVNGFGSAPTVSSVVVNGGAPAYTDSQGYSVSLADQNSVVEQLLVTFNEAVTLAPGAFSIINNAAGVTVVAGETPNSLAVNAVWGAPVAGSGNTQWIVTFSGPGTTALAYGGIGSVIKDGLYKLHINAADVTAIAGGLAMTADSDTGFWAMYGSVHDIIVSSNIGDGNSEVFVDSNDFNEFVAAFNSGADSSLPTYDVAMDYDLDGFYDADTFNTFVSDFNVGNDWVF